MQHCSTVWPLVLKGKGLSTSFHMLTGKENIFTSLYTQLQYDPYTVTESLKKKKKGVGGGGWKVGWGGGGGGGRGGGGIGGGGERSTTLHKRPHGCKSESRRPFLTSFFFLLLSHFPALHISLTRTDCQYLMWTHYNLLASRSQMLICLTSKFRRWNLNVWLQMFIESMKLNR